MIEVYRLHARKYSAYDGTGAAMYGGRWNVPGDAAIYTAGSRSLATLEVLVHYAVLPKDFVITPIHIPASLFVPHLDEDDLPHGWHLEINLSRTVALQWFINTAVLDVPSAIIRQERIYVLNPNHSEFKHIKFLTPEPFDFDPGLK